MQENSMITVKKNTYETVDFNNDYTLPDYITDVRKLVRCDGKAVVHNIYKNDSMLTFEGEVIYSILVVCDDNTIKNLIYSEEFSINGTNPDKCEFSVNECKLEGLSSRLISPRKLNCRSKVVITTKNNVEEGPLTEYCGTGMPEAELTAEKMLSKCRYIVFSEAYVQNQYASKDIELSSDKREISNIVYCKVNVHINERKVAEEKLYLRGSAVTEILYEDIEGNYVKYTDRSPFSEIIDNHNSAAAHICEVIVSDIKASVRNNSFGEMKIVELDYTYNIKCRCYTERETELLCDVYSVEYDVECECDKISAYKLNTMFSSSLSINDSLSADEIGEDDFREAVDCSVSVLNSVITSDRKNKKIIITGDLKFDIVFKAEEYGYYSVTKPYKYEREYDGCDGEIYCEHYITALDVSCTNEKGRLLLNTELYFNVMVAECCEYEYKKKVKFANCDSVHSCPVIIYYPTKGDTLWEIAKKYKSTCKDIISANSLTSDSLDGIKVLLLPKKKKRAIMNTII